jgi:PAS domain S-box-containing protein
MSEKTPANVVTLQREVDRQHRVHAVVTKALAERTKRLAESDALFRLLVTSVKDYALFMLDPNGIVATWNAGAERFKGYTADEIIGRHFSVFYPEAEVRNGKCERELEIARRVGQYEEEGWRIRKDGARFWAGVVITAVYDETGELVGYAKVTRDLTERKASEESRLKAEERYRHLIESVKDYAIFILDPHGNVSTWNEGAQRIKGYTADEIIGSHFSRFYPQEDVRAGKCEMELEVAARVGRFEDEDWRVRKDGSRFWANVVISAIYDEHGTVTGFSKVTRDLTDRKRAEDDRAARAAAEEANRTKDQFLAMLGHELRNPLAPILTALQLMRLRGDERSLREVQIIERQVKQMNRLVDDLLDVSRVGRGKIELQRQELDLRDVLAKSAEIAIPLFEKKNQHFEVHAPPYPLAVNGDEARLIQVFTNLLNNASRYTQENGHVTVTVDQRDKEIFVKIRDNGRGIAPQLLPRIFDLFVQAHQNIDRSEGGLGLGLTLVRSLVDIHGGRVDAESGGLGQGATFTVRLPALHAITATPPAQSSLAAAFKPAANRRRILVVDDNEDARLLLVDILTRLGHDVQSAGDGPGALSVLDKFDADVAVLDLGLPGMDGYELAERIRKSKHDSIRLLALSGYARGADVARSREVGFDLHLVKPVDVQKLLDSIMNPASV